MMQDCSRRERLARQFARAYAFYLQPHQDGQHANRYEAAYWRNFVEEADALEVVPGA